MLGWAEMAETAATRPWLRDFWAVEERILPRQKLEEMAQAMVAGEAVELVETLASLEARVGLVLPVSWSSIGRNDWKALGLADWSSFTGRHREEGVRLHGD